MTGLLNTYAAAPNPTPAKAPTPTPRAAPDKPAAVYPNAPPAAAPSKAPARRKIGMSFHASTVAFGEYIVIFGFEGPLHD